jgi:hypothetical protein
MRRPVSFVVLLALAGCSKKSEPPIITVQSVSLDGKRPVELPADWPLCGAEIDDVVRTGQHVIVGLKGNLDAKAIIDCYLAHKELRVIFDRTLGTDARALKLEDARKNVVGVAANGRRIEDVSLMVEPSPATP